MKTTLIIIFVHLALLSYLVLYNIDAWADVLTCPNGMTLINGGKYRMGDNHSGFVEEKVIEDVSVKDFCIDTYEVSNAQFAEFVAATGYKTVAERPLSVEQFPDLPDRERSSGSLVFIAPEEGGSQVPYLSWWHWIPGASWQHPQGIESSIIDTAYSTIS